MPTLPVCRQVGGRASMPRSSRCSLWLPVLSGTWRARPELRINRQARPCSKLSGPAGLSREPPATCHEARCVLSDTVEFGGWPRPPRWMWATAGIAAVAVLVGVVAAHSGPHHATSSSRPEPHPAWVIKTPGGVAALAVGGPMLYVATGDYPGAVLSAFSRVTGHLVRRVGIPGAPGALRVGPGGFVWLTFYPDQNGGAAELRLLSPDLGQGFYLRLHAGSTVPLDVFPVGRSAALVAANGLVDVHMPVPGHVGQWVIHRVSALPTDHGYDAVEVARLAGRVAVLQNNNAGHYRIVLAGQRRPAFDPGSGVSINSMASGGGSLWITTGPGGTAPMSKAVIRLNDRLEAVTPRSLSKNPAIAFPQMVWATGNTVVVSTRLASKPLVCFRFQNGQAGPVTSIPARLPPAQLAVTGDTIYVADARGVVPYRLPAPCR